MGKTREERRLELDAMIKSTEGKSDIKRRFLDLQRLPPGRFEVALKPFSKMAEDILDSEFADVESDETEDGSATSARFNTDEQNVLRFLERVVVEGHRESNVLTGPATSPEKVKAACGIDELTYRRIITRLESLGIAEAIAPRAPDEWINVHSKIVEAVRGLDTQPVPSSSSQSRTSKRVSAHGSPGKPMSKNFPTGWARGDELGKGGQAQVYKATRDGSEETFALKLLKKGALKAAYERFAQEIEAVKKLNHASIIKIIEHSEPDAEIPYYVMEYVPEAKSLRQLMNSGQNPFHRNEAESVRMFIRILDGLEACKASGIVHRDLSPANILVLPDKTIKIIDFGLCQIADGHAVTLTDENIGTPNYMAPECESHSRSTIMFCADLYSAGKILWSAITNQNAFAREDRVFDDLSMQKRFPDNPQAWHLQMIFQKSIRHAIADRWPNPAEALSGSWRVYQMITSGTLPVEMLTRSCPICRWGTMLEPAQAFPEGGYLLFGQELKSQAIRLVCNHCCYCFMIAKEIHQKTLAARRNLN